MDDIKDFLTEPRDPNKKYVVGVGHEIERGYERFTFAVMEITKDKGFVVVNSGIVETKSVGRQHSPYWDFCGDLSEHYDAEVYSIGGQPKFH